MRSHFGAAIVCDRSGRTSSCSILAETKLMVRHVRSLTPAFMLKHAIHLAASGDKTRARLGLFARVAVHRRSLAYLSTRPSLSHAVAVASSIVSAEDLLRCIAPRLQHGDPEADVAIASFCVRLCKVEGGPLHFAGAKAQRGSKIHPIPTTTSEFA